MYRFISKLAWLALGFAIPGYQTYKLLKSGFGLVHVNEFQNLLKFWLVIATFTCISFFTDTFLFWFPFYYEFKIFLIFYITLPQTRGFLTIYEKLVCPNLNAYEKDIDAQAKVCSDFMHEQASRWYELGSKYIFELWRLCLAKSAEAMSRSLNPALSERPSEVQQSKPDKKDPITCYPEASGPSARDQPNDDGSWFSNLESLKASTSLTNTRGNLSSKPNERATNSATGSSTMSSPFQISKKYDMSANDINKYYDLPRELLFSKGSETSATSKFKPSPSSEDKRHANGYLRGPPFQTSPNSNMRSRFNQPV
ncbi:Receptor expression-enhancing protein 2 [Entomophthora muscae]|uniref:Receptor expression-enhancing protein 2 n=1 Tax=Entomophthora muscae TaxID=34485 RepID=A0ACC2SSE4_9FUNG|nr:Receptor expression-enhancing protein 2 [Entomophthora muscae]